MSAIKFNVILKREGESDDSCWKEEYTKNVPSPVDWARETIDWFNSTLRPGERRRVFLRVELLGEADEKEHDFGKTNLVTIVRGESAYDTVECSRCKITGKRYGISSPIRDSKFKAEVYRRCDTAMAHLRKKGKIK